MALAFPVPETYEAGSSAILVWAVLELSEASPSRRPLSDTILLRDALVVTLS